MLAHHLKTALRQLRGSRLHALINAAGLMLGLTCAITAYVLVDYLRGSERHFAAADRIYTVYQRAAQGLPFQVMSSSLLRDLLEADFPELEAVARSSFSRDMAVAVDGSDSFQSVQRVDPAFLRMFDLPFITGSAGALDEPTGAVLTESAAQALFGTTDALGRALRLQDSVDLLVTGVIAAVPKPSFLAESFLGSGFDLLISIGALPDPTLVASWGRLSVLTHVLLPSDGSMTAESFNAQLSAFSDRHIDAAANAGAAFAARPVSSITVGALDSFVLGGQLGVSVAGLVLGLGALILTIACVNFANLSAASAIDRAREAGIRKALGARRSSIARLYLVEAAVQVLGSVALGVIASALLLRALSIPLPLTSLRFLGLLALLAGSIALFCGGYPAALLSRAPPISVSRTKFAAGAAWLRTALIGAQFAAAGSLLIVTIVMYSQQAMLRQRALGVLEDPYVVINTRLQEAKVDFALLKSELLQSPAIRAVAAVDMQPWNLGSLMNRFSRAPDDAGGAWHQRRFVSEDYFSTLGVPLLAGRAFSPLRDAVTPLTASDRDPRITYPIVVARSTAVGFGWSDPYDAVGQLVYVEGRPLTIIGVSEDYALHLRGLSSFVYYFNPDAVAFPIIRLSRDGIADALAHVEATWNELAPSFPLRHRFMDDQFAQAYAMYALLNRGFMILGSIAFAIASMGLLGMAVHAARRRSHEIGVRKTQGATSRQIFSRLVLDFAGPIAIANLAAWPFAYLIAQRYLALFMHRIELTPVPFVAGLAITLLLALLAIVSQVLRASRLKPVDVLRQE